LVISSSQVAFPIRLARNHRPAEFSGPDLRHRRLDGLGRGEPAVSTA
jgi:hypothetical protein